MNYDDAMEGHPIIYAQAERELRKHGFRTQMPTSAAFAGHIFGEMTFGDGSTEWEPIALNTRAVLEWLGY